MDNTIIPEQIPVKTDMKKVFIANLSHTILILSAMLGTIVAWNFGGPVAGMIWSAACFTFGTMFGMLLQKKLLNHSA